MYYKMISSKSLFYRFINSLVIKVEIVICSNSQNCTVYAAVEFIRFCMTIYLESVKVEAGCTKLYCHAREASEGIMKITMMKYNGLTKLTVFCPPLLLYKSSPTSD